MIHVCNKNRDFHDVPCFVSRTGVQGMQSHLFFCIIYRFVYLHIKLLFLTFLFILSFSPTLSLLTLPVPSEETVSNNSPQDLLYFPLERSVASFRTSHPDSSVFLRSYRPPFTTPPVTTLSPTSVRPRPGPGTEYLGKPCNNPKRRSHFLVRDLPTPSPVPTLPYKVHFRYNQCHLLPPTLCCTRVL